MNDADSLGSPSFLITIDTEGDNLWSKPHTITTRNARYLPRFQALCERYGFKPTYLTNWEMANCPVFREFGRDIISRTAGEIGMHLHAWNSPPLTPLTEDDDLHQPYLIEYPEDQIREKVRVMTGVLEDTFGIKMVSHRAGRWSFNKVYARILIEQDYRVDCSVTPHISWATDRGDPRGKGGTDFSHFPETAYFLDPEDISLSDNSPLLEVPVTITQFRYPRPVAILKKLLRRTRFGERVARRLFPPYAWLRPKGRDRSILLAVLSAAREERRNYVEFMLHSSELMPGGSPKFPSARSIEELYEDLEALFEAASEIFWGRTLSEYHDVFTTRGAMV